MVNLLFVDCSASQFLSKRLDAGLVGYAYYQLTADDYSTSGYSGTIQLNLIGDMPSQVFAIGRQMSYFFNAGNSKVYSNLRFYQEFDAQNRTEGQILMRTIGIPLSML